MLNPQKRAWNENLAGPYVQIYPCILLLQGLISRLYLNLYHFLLLLEYEGRDNLVEFVFL